jgi:ankyrin repeat protein
MNENQLRCWLVQAGFKISDPLQADINHTLPDGTTPLMYAARVGDCEAVQGLLARGADPALLNTDGLGALWFACYANSEACVSTLILANAPLDTQNINGATALIYSSSSGKAAMVKLLLQAGADAELVTLDDFSALELAANPDCLRLLKAARKVAHV